MEILTDIELRSHWFRTHEKNYHLPENTMLTPAARDFVKEHGITLVYEPSRGAGGRTSGAESVQPGRQMESFPNADVKPGGKRTAVGTGFPGTGSANGTSAYKPMPMASVPKGAGGRPQYVNGRDGSVLDEKPENMTHLHGNVLVPKTHPQIAFRGKLDSLQAQILSLQVLCAENGLKRLTDALDEVLGYVRSILSAEVLDHELSEIHLLGLDSEGLRHESHHIKEIYGIPHPLPDYHMGRICMGLNELRTLVREAELAAANAFSDGDVCTRPDIVEAMNRLSSVIYILFCRQLTGRWPGVPEEEFPPFLVEASGRHVHLTEEAIRILFGEELHPNAQLSQPGQYAAKERVRLVTAKGEIDRVVVLGPPRKEVQVEMSLTDARILGIEIPVNLSGDLRGAGDVILVGPKGIYPAPGSAIASRAHIHMTPEDAARYEVRDGDRVSVRLKTDRPVTIDDVVIRVNENFALAMHMDYDEANACSYKKGDVGYIVK